MSTTGTSFRSVTTCHNQVDFPPAMQIDGKHSRARCLPRFSLLAQALTHKNQLRDIVFVEGPVQVKTVMLLSCRECHFSDS